MSTKVAIIGAGGMAQYHIAGFRQAGAEIVAIADLNEDAAKATASQYGVGQTFGSIETMFDTLTDLDAVSIIVPNKFHAPSPFRRFRQAGMCFARSHPLSMRPMLKR